MVSFHVSSGTSESFRHVEHSGREDWGKQSKLDTFGQVAAKTELPVMLVVLVGYVWGPRWHSSWQEIMGLQLMKCWTTKNTFRFLRQLGDRPFPESFSLTIMCGSKVILLLKFVAAAS